MNTANEQATRERAPIREGLFSGPLTDLARIRLVGCKCTNCGETSFGKRTVCANCGRETVQDVALGESGVLWSFTILRHRPPGNYKGPEPFVPFGLGLVELPDGLRVLSPIECEIDKLKIGLPLRFKPYVRHDAERDVVAFAFAPINDQGAGHV